MTREHLERLLREPNNLFGPPTGRGYDYVGAGLVAAALALAALSTWALIDRLEHPDRPAAAAVPLTALAVPALAGWQSLWFLWPFDLPLGGVVAVGVWYATLYTAACRVGLRCPRRVVFAGAILVAVAGWTVGGYWAARLWA